jgi:hypothetical protein
METGNAERLSEIEVEVEVGPNGPNTTFDVIRDPIDIMELRDLVTMQLEEAPIGYADTETILADMISSLRLPGSIIITGGDEGELNSFTWGVPISEYGKPVLFAKMVQSPSLDHTKGMWEILRWFAQAQGFKRVITARPDRAEAMARALGMDVFGVLIGKDL